jgi:hypothetical protein
MVDSIKLPNPAYRPNETIDEGTALFNAAKAHGLEGIIAKERNSVYTPGKRASHWFKIKTHNTADCVIIGYTKGKGDRESTFGALQLGLFRGKQLVYVGKVGTGFNSKSLAELHKRFQKEARGDCPFADLPSKQGGQWIQGITPGTMRKCHWINTCLNRTERQAASNNQGIFAKSCSRRRALEWERFRPSPATKGNGAVSAGVRDHNTVNSGTKCR